MTRLMRRYRESGAVRECCYQRNRFASRYTAGDIELLATLDEAHENLSGPATHKILYRELHDYGDRRLRATGQDLGGAYLQPAQEPRISRA